MFESTIPCNARTMDKLDCEKQDSGVQKRILQPSNGVVVGFFQLHSNNTTYSFTQIPTVKSMLGHVQQFFKSIL